jgi:predicted RNA-binding protein with PUA-like domain
MNYWIFQCNPDDFDVDEYLRRITAQNPSEFRWNVRQHAKDMAKGDQVFIWRAAGNRGCQRGIIAMGELIGSPRQMRVDPPSRGCWLTDEPGRMALRVEAVVRRICIGTKETIPADRLKQDPVVSNMGILKCPRATNFRITAEVAKRLKALVEKRVDVSSVTYADFGEAPNDNPYELQFFAARVRRGQRDFRRNLMEVYARRCAISGHGPEDALNAVHIEPHAESGINELGNGLLMRADLHSLFDAGLLRINPTSLKVVIDPKLRGTPYQEFHGRKIRARNDGTQPSQYLKKRWQAGKLFDL